MTTRTDIHRPSAIVPEDYEYVALEYQRCDGASAVEAVLYHRKVIQRHMERTGGTYAHHEHGGNCHVCGASAVYTVLYYHAKSNSYIRTGQDCAQKLDMSCGDVNAFRRAIQDAREAQAGKKKAVAILGDLGLSAAWDIYCEPFPIHADDCKARGVDAHGDDNGVNNPCTCDLSARGDRFNRWEESTIRDIVGKLVKYGSISEKQSGFVRNLLDKIVARPIVEARRQAEREAAADCPSGRVVI